MTNENAFDAMTPAMWSGVIDQLEQLLDQAMATAQEPAFPEPVTTEPHDSVVDRLTRLLDEAATRSQSAAEQARAAEESLSGPLRDWQTWLNRLETASDRLVAAPPGSVG
jgi:hypothetical protein